MSGTITIAAAKLGSYEERTGRSAHQCTSPYSPPVLSFCSQNIHSHTLNSYMSFGLVGRGQTRLEENTEGWKGKASSTIIPTIHETSIHGLSTRSLMYGNEPSHKQFMHFIKVVKFSTD
jgi:hypothetical protein